MTLIERFLTGEYTVERSTKGTYIRGKYQIGPVETIKVCGSLQPSNARELKLPEEGNRFRQYFKFFTDAPIVVGSSATLASGDRVVINGERFRAMNLTHWDNTDLDYFVTVLWREPAQTDDGKGAGQ